MFAAHTAAKAEFKEGVSTGQKRGEGDWTTKSHVGKTVGAKGVPVMTRYPMLQTDKKKKKIVHVSNRGNRINQ